MLYFHSSRLVVDLGRDKMLIWLVREMQTMDGFLPLSGLYARRSCVNGLT